MAKVIKYAALAMFMVGGFASAQAAEKGHYDASGNLLFNVVTSDKGDPRLAEVADYVLTYIKPLASDPLLIKMVKAQDTETKKLK
jgi:hypothetical protein